MLSMAVHNLTCRKELVQVLRKLKIGISYNDVIDLLSTWAQKEYIENVQNSCGPKRCPNNITKDVPAVAIVDNDDFMEDCLTGGDTSHYTNLLMAQLQPANQDTEQNLSATTKNYFKHLTIPKPSVRKQLACPKIK